jgi:biofilm PGA synthesis N-glycosyltransferase PgaC
MLKYVVISPVRDEERYVELTLDSMARQTVKPERWIIVDDGSTDRTPEIIARYQKEHDFIQIVQSRPGQARQPGGSVVRAFNHGFAAVGKLDFDLVVKLDCDLSFDPDYFEKLGRMFAADPKLGIASGVYAQQSEGQVWTEVMMPPYHAAGASKVVRRECFQQIGGFISARGWDTVDEIRAMTRGWRTCHFPELRMKHWKPEGSGIGWWGTRHMHGEVYYLTGGSKLFFFLKVLHCLKSSPVLLGGIAMFWGYFDAMLRRKPRLVTPEERRVYRALLNGRIAERFRSLLRSN